MNTVIASYLKDRILEGITWADLVVGMVKTLTFQQPVENGQAVKKAIPISCDLEVSQRDCIANKQHHVVPDSKLKALIYFEDSGAVPAGKTPRGLAYTATIKLVCWMNLPKLGHSSCSVSALAMTQLIEVLDGIGKTTSVNLFADYGVPINSVKVTEISIDPKSASIFSKYTYDETKTQYLMYPYDYFSLTLKVSFEIPKGCIGDWTNPEIPCPEN
jgi:hypothetical protein